MENNVDRQNLNQFWCNHRLLKLYFRSLWLQPPMPNQKTEATSKMIASIPKNALSAITCINQCEIN